MKYYLLWLLILFSCSSFAQKSLYFSPLQNSQVRYGNKVKKIYKQNHTDIDSMRQMLNEQIINGIKLKVPGVKVIIADSNIFRLINDSSEIKQMLSTPHLEAMKGKKGFERIKVRTESGSTFYEGRELNTGGQEAMKNVMIQSGADYFILLNEFRGGVTFELQYEVYDRNFTKIFGDKFIRKPSLSGKMYYSAFLFHFNKYVEALNEQLVKSIR